MERTIAAGGTGEPLATRWKILLVLFTVFVVSDQLTKFWAVSRLTRTFQVQQAATLSEEVDVFLSAHKLERLRTPPVVVLEDYWQFRYVENPGAAWGILGRMPDGVRIPFFHVVSAVAICFIVIFFKRLEEHQRLLQVALSMVLGGAVGNFIDRLLRGYEIDFIDWHWRNDPDLHWPTFNVADSGISVGVVLMLLEGLLVRKGASQAAGMLPATDAIPPETTGA
ncbi:MAG: signal peptidase II [Deltaproteobacteria bacterium]|nr:signal peptidase II [Deltaproteobacteria bacterium]